MPIRRAVRDLLARVVPRDRRSAPPSAVMPVDGATDAKVERPRRERSRLRREPGTTEILPSLGYFGGIAANYLAVAVTGGVREIELFLPRREEGQLDLRGIELYRGGRRIALDGDRVDVTQSSDATKDDRSPFMMGGIRTKREVGPWWRMWLAETLDVDEIRVYNRLDGFGRRNRRLTVAYAADDGRFTPVSTDSDRVVRSTLDLLARLTAITVTDEDLGSVERARALRRELLARLADRAREGLLTADPTEQRLVLSAIRLEPGSDDEEPSDDEWALLGHALAAERHRVPTTATSIRTFHLLLRTRARLERLAREANAAGEVVGTPPAVLSRHGLVDDGGLRARSDEYLDTIERASRLLGDLGYPTMLAYGTLLGAVREKDFLAHDDDVDLMVPLEAMDRDSAEPVLGELRLALQQKGWKVTRPNSYTNFHLHDPSNGLHVDVFPLFVDGERTTLHMEKMKLRSIATSIVMPPAPITFKGRELLGPAKPEAFLAERYGDGWSVSDPYYDWPWRLDG
ncbi:hypothetical protein GCM10023216_07390 [Isoptericola chiayiensis]|uniref:LicD/FKTN/FKRP nucleotidyltransferase domain-containing protein n=2 Tax=Isoptericola chiayiensis TaxID=579446 RepID=A0ABP8Y7R7_9MICO